MAELEQAQLRDVEWLGDSRAQVRSWPKAATSQVGTELYAVQLGEYPDGCERLQEVGPDVHALRIRSGKEQYRVIWLAKVEDVVYVLHAFHKKSKKGKANPASDIAVARARLKEARELIDAGKAQARGRRQ